VPDPSRFFEGSKGLGFPSLLLYSVYGVDMDQTLFEFRVEQEATPRPVFRAGNQTTNLSGLRNAVSIILRALASRHSLVHKRKTAISELVLISRMPGMHPFVVDPVWAIGRSKRK
jgi:hypothetical protein